MGKRQTDKRKKTCFSKKLLIADYTVLFLLIGAFMAFTALNMDTTNCAIVIGGWTAQIAVSSGFYYWKSKAENLIKMPVMLLDDLPADMRDRADPNAIIASVLGIGTNS